MLVYDLWGTTGTWKEVNPRQFYSELSTIQGTWDPHKKKVKADSKMITNCVMKKYLGRTLADITHGKIISPRTRNNGIII